MRRVADRRSVSFVKWAGSKRQILPRLRALTPSSFGTYYEPMVGSGSLFLSLDPQAAVLGDCNAELVNCFVMIRDRVDELIAALGRHVNTKAHFLRTRALDPEELPEVERAARTIYLNKTCYNGLYRVSKKGAFNVPYGGITWAKFKDEETLRRVHDRLQGTTLRCADFEETVRAARSGDLVYLDPPYVPENRLAPSFVAYQPGALTMDDHRRIARVFRALARRGCMVLISNANAEPRTWGWKSARL